MLTEVEKEQGHEGKQEQEREFTFTVTVKAPASEVYRAFTHPVSLRDWLCNAAEVEPRAGGRFYLWWDRGYYTSGTYTELARNERVGFTWRGPNDPEQSQVLVTIAAEGEATTVTLAHTGIGVSEDWKDIAAKDRRGWDVALENLQSILETGKDLRLVRRPLFGLNGAAQLDEELAAKLGVPVVEGLHITGLVEGLSAHNAGVRAGDVLVGIGDRPVRDYTSLGSAMSLHQAGDRVPITFYRDGEQQTVTAELSPRTIPEVPGSFVEMARLLGEGYAEVNRQLDELMAGITEEEAEYRPDNDSWNAKEVLAHLVAVEYDSHITLANCAKDTPADPPYYANELLRLRAIVNAFGSMAALAEELKRMEEVSVQMMAAIPSPAADRMRNIFLFGQGYTAERGIAFHSHQHLDEIRSLVEAARSR